MTDETFTPAHRLTLDALKDGSAVLDSERAAITAALAEIARLTAENGLLRRSLKMVVMQHAEDEIAQLQAEVVRLMGVAPKDPIP